MSESVLCVRSECLSRIFHEDVANPRWSASIVGSNLSTARLFSLPVSDFCVGFRPEVEHNEEVKQIITYTILLYDRTVLTYARTKKTGEGRLRGKFSIGIGGHVQYPENLDTICFAHPSSLYNYVLGESCRELNEEIGLRYENDLIFNAPIGLIYDPSDAVGRVHLGVVFAAGVIYPDSVVSKCDHLSDTEFLEPSAILTESNAYESWSRLLIESSILE